LRVLWLPGNLLNNCFEQCEHSLQNNGMAYSLGHSDSELARLQKQAEFYADFTRSVFLKAGIQPGMHILDVGCGVGDVSMEAARIVGPTGSVLGIDQSEAALDLARHRVTHSGLPQASFRKGDLMSVESDIQFDAVIGRFILLHLRDPASALRSLTQRVKRGGSVAFIEMDLTSAQVCPPLELFDDAVGWIREVYIREGVEIDMGSKLFACFAQLGMKPKLEAFQRIEGGPDAQVYDYLAETVRSLAPRMTALGVVDHDVMSLPTLAERTKAAAVQGGHCFFYPRMVGAWARRP
jgi:ubiquinone/menaquinone biosynthesis C-methylase UbiE